ncbi:hypothetical protein GCM10009665_78160 [Kitasatospora nipponensis]|uniref:MobA-like NTP transferase domain-containing protein n=1 Tax=Kitasatospora nipponensis TaxID=258049 RepID=A0ABN1TAZ5_9ACTN
MVPAPLGPGRGADTGSMTLPFDPIVLAGGAASRLGGADKPHLEVGGRTLLQHVLAAFADARTVVLVGPPPPDRPETADGDGPARTREEPPGGGPAAAGAAGLAHPGISAEVVLLLAADLPFLDVDTVRRLVEALAEPGAGWEAAVLVDADGRDQPLVGAYRAAALRAALAALGEPANRPLRRLTGGLRTVRLADPAGAGFDCDTWEALAQARHRARVSGGG